MTIPYTVCKLDNEIFRDSLRGLHLSELQALVSTCRVALLGYTPELMRESIGLSHVYAGFLADLLRELPDLVTGEQMSWDGFTGSMTPTEWARAMLYVAEAMARSSPDFVHPLETDYPALVAKRTEAEARRLEQSTQTSPPPRAAIPVADGPPAFNTNEEGEDLHVTMARIDAERKAANAARKAEDLRRAVVMAAPPAFVLVDEKSLIASTPVGPAPLVAIEDAKRNLLMPAVPEGSMHLTHFVSRTAITSVGAKRKPRSHWFEGNPRVIDKISGFASNSILMRYSGEELRTGDIELWCKLLEWAAKARDKEGNILPLGERIDVAERELLLALNRGTGGTAFKALRAERTRLQTATLHIRATYPAFIEQMAQLFPTDKAILRSVKEGRLEMRTHLLGGDSADGRTWSIAIPPLVRAMFGKGFSSWIDEGIYYSLTGDQARRLFMLYASHVSCYPLSLPELREFLGSTYRKASDFRDAMDKAHDELVRAGVIRSWAFKRPDRRRLAASCYEVRRNYKVKRTIDV
jgi:hypothetical protein